MQKCKETSEKENEQLFDRSRTTETECGLRALTDSDGLRGCW